MARTHVGRHRAPGFSPLNELADIAAKSTQPAVKVSAVAVASGGLVAAFAIPASASQSQDIAAGSAVTNVAQVAAQPAVAVAAPAVDQAYVPTFGVVGFSAKAPAAPAPAAVEITKIEAPAPAAAPAPAVTTARASRTTTRTTTTPAPAAAAASTAKTAVAAAVAPAAAPAAAAAPAPTGGIISIADSLSGIYYIYGGTTTAGFDCSGFTSYVYRQAGKSIPRTAEEQRAASTKVTNPVPGDLIFFGFPAYHVGIYAGNGQMYDSPRTGKTSGLHVIWTQSGVSYGRF